MPLLKPPLIEAHEEANNLILSHKKGHLFYSRKDILKVLFNHPSISLYKATQNSTTSDSKILHHKYSLTKIKTSTKANHLILPNTIKDLEAPKIKVYKLVVN